MQGGTVLDGWDGWIAAQRAETMQVRRVIWAKPLAVSVKPRWNKGEGLRLLAACLSACLSACLLPA